MPDTIISVESLSKRYLVGHEGPKERYHSLRDTIVWHGKKFVRNTLDMAKGKQIVQGDTVEEFWALKDCSFEVKRGEVLGIIGRNGAGKSTLLKVLSRITEPSKGRVVLRGRVASLLEVGTGFHPELTGRENIFLNGAILGMSRAEIRAKFDEIVAFAEVEKFLDTPVKRYSSGMYVRLAFAVAAHLDPEILIVDEVLAVGDTEFQKKCLGKMQEVSMGGRTVLFVSHNMAAIQRLCHRCIMLKDGTPIASGSTESVIGAYLNEGSGSTDFSLEHFPKRSGSGSLRLTDFFLENMSGTKIKQIQSGSDFYLVFKFKCASPLGVRKVNIGFSLHQPDETPIAVFYSSYAGQIFENVPQSGTFRCHIKSLPLKEGRYLVAVRVEAEEEEADWPRGMVGTLEVITGDFYGAGAQGYDGAAPLLLSAEWSVK
jgi:lipopolysaccharide transport system ATP-binding protein